MAGNRRGVLFVPQIRAVSWSRSIDGLARHGLLARPPGRPHRSDDDDVLATGQTHTVRHIGNLAFTAAGITLDWQVTGTDEVGVCRATGRTLVRVDPAYFRPTEVDLLNGNPARARRMLGWKRTVSGIPRRAFKHVDDVAEACALLLRAYSCEEPFSSGITIAELVEDIERITGFRGASPGTRRSPTARCSSTWRSCATMRWAGARASAWAMGSMRTIAGSSRSPHASWSGSRGTVRGVRRGLHAAVFVPWALHCTARSPRGPHPS